MNRLAIALAAFWTLSAPQFASADQSRVALVIGNGEYRSARLDNPANDARTMAAALRETGFEVVEGIDLDQKAMRRAIQTFGRKLEAAGAAGTGLFYFSGHGIQARDQNYLIPVDADLRNEADLEVEAVSAQAALRQMESAGNAVNLVILDACRDNPFKSMTRSLGSKGLARMDAPRGSLVAYATAPGDTASDGTGANSPFTRALADALRVPGLRVEDVFKRVRNQVFESTGKRQIPWESSSLTGDFYFRPPEVAATPVPLPAESPALDPDAQACEVMRSTPIPSVVEAYLKEFPEGRCAGYARIQREAHRASAPSQVASLRPEVRTPPDECAAYSGTLRDTCAKAVAGDARASYEMGDALREARGGRRNLNAAAEWFKKSADGGDLDGLAAWGRANANGEGVAYNYSVAADALRRAASQGNVIGMGEYGGLLFLGLGVAKDKNAGLRMISESAERGYLGAKSGLASVLWTGEEIAMDRSRAMELFRFASARGDASAQAGLGMILLHGYGVPKDEKAGAELLRKAAEFGDPGGLLWWANALQRGSGVRANPALALEAYKNAKRKIENSAEQGSAAAQSILGDIYFAGQGVAEDLEAAAKWYRKAAEQGNAFAQNSLGYMYLAGLGVAEDLELAAKWIRKSAEQKNLDGMTNYALMLLNGKGVPVDRDEARKWLKRAADAGHERAKQLLASNGG